MGRYAGNALREFDGPQQLAVSVHNLNLISSPQHDIIAEHRQGTRPVERFSRIDNFVLAEEEQGIAAPCGSYGAVRSKRRAHGSVAKYARFTQAAIAVEDIEPIPEDDPTRTPAALAARDEASNGT